ncbi:hypothetical protein CAPTEDRAFT_117326 [Capitella teleta]|uniref:Dynein assembly factor 1, axonemal homolog n=1 Tax=Capitella teleta TaxID=283909 RepID=R7UVJ1_CAPTE|nr:hypothetical protein CAPTEDRAFT_117326 [Capitella teleta]|eukprot:ELU10267.1 hypothetical protein CAPTEDRAFT_117326 [Capitella teleta]
MCAFISGRITKQLLKSASGEFDIESIHSLIMQESNISDLGCIGECFGLERLDLSCNDITKLYALAGLTNLLYVNLSANRITSLEGLQALDNLTMLNLSGNLIASMDTVQCLSSLEKLRDIRLQDALKGLSNPICMNTSYKKDVLNILSNIHTLDGERVRGRGKELSELCEEMDELLKSEYFVLLAKHTNSYKFCCSTRTSGVG